MRLIPRICSIYGADRNHRGRTHADYRNLARNAAMYGQDVSLVEINPEVPDTRPVTWREYELIEASPLQSTDGNSLAGV
jgi:hypothetical protein